MIDQWKISSCAANFTCPKVVEEDEREKRVQVLVHRAWDQLDQERRTADPLAYVDDHTEVERTFQEASLAFDVHLTLECYDYHRLEFHEHLEDHSMPVMSELNRQQFDHWEVDHRD